MDVKMILSSSSLVNSLADRLERVGPESIMAFERHTTALMISVGKVIHEDSPSSLSHAQHATFMVSQFNLPSPRSLVAAMAGWYRTGIQSGVSPDIFRETFNAWQRAVVHHLPAPEARPIASIYECLADNHEELLRLAQVDAQDNPVDSEHLAQYSRFVDYLLAPDSAGAINQTRQAIHNISDIVVWWEHILQPALYQIGQKWALGEITVGQEHMATAIVQRIMAIHYPMILEHPRARGTAIVAATPGELHEVGPRMLADLLEINGWNVHYIGANTPQDSVLSAVESLHPDCVCLSTALYRHLPRVRNVLTALRERIIDRPCRLMVGGQAYHADPTLWQRLGADGYAETASAAVCELCSEETP